MYVSGMLKFKIEETKMSTKKITEHTTETGKILFMAVARPLLNAKTGKEEFSVKMELNNTDTSISHLEEVASYKVDTKTNRKLAGTNKVVVNFSSEFAPVVLDSNNNKMEGREIPFFDGRVDSGTAVVSYKVINYGDNTIVRLSGIKLLSLELAPRENSTTDSLDVTLEKLKNIT